MKALTIYFHYFIVYLKSRAVYKFDFIVGLFSHLLIGAFGLLFVLMLIDGEQIQSLDGWSRDEVIFIYGYSLLSLSLFNSVSVNLFRFGDRYVNGGQFDRVLLRPLNTIAQVIFESFNLDAIGTFILGLAVLTKSAIALQIQFGFLDVVWLIVSIVSGAAILISVFICLASLAFHFDDKLGIGAPVYSLINFGRYPISIFNKFLQFFLSFVIPFAFVAFYPATHFFEDRGYLIYCYLTPFVAIVAVLIARLTWRFGEGKYTSTGF